MSAAEPLETDGFGWTGGILRIIGWIGLSVLFGLVAGAVAGMLFDSGSMMISAIAMAGGSMVAGAVMLRGVDARAPAALGIGFSPETPRHLLVGLVIGAAGLLAAVMLMIGTGAVTYATQQGTTAAWITIVAQHAAFFFVAALAEEAAFRGYGFQVLTRLAGAPAAIAVSSALFAVAHGSNPDVGVFALVNIFLAGILLAVAYLRTLSLWFATALHMGWNWAMATLFDLPVSGLAMFDTPLYEPRIGGADWWSGGAFGPEGGMVGTIGFCAALLITLKWRAVRQDQRILEAGPLVVQREQSRNDG